MEITVSSPSSPGTSLTDNVKDQILRFYNELEKNYDFESLSKFKEHLEKIGLNPNYTRNILPFLQYCGIVKYDKVSVFKNKEFFTNIGQAYIDVLKSLKIAKQESFAEEYNDIIAYLEKIQMVIYFQSLVIMMKSKKCNYSRDFFDVLIFVNKYGYIDSTEYLLLLYEKNQESENYIDKMSDKIAQYRDGTLEILVKTKTKNTDSGSSKSVNSFPYVSGNFEKAGIFYKSGEKFYINDNRRAEIDSAIREVYAL